MKCHICNHEVSNDDTICKNCNANLKQEESILLCSKCGSQLEADEKYCRKCGYINNLVKTNPKPVLVSDTKYKNLFFFSLSIVLFAFLFGDLIFMVFPIILILFSLGIIAFSGYEYLKTKNKKVGWTIAIAILALIMSSINFMDDLIEKDYANNSASRINQVLDSSFSNIRPTSYDINYVEEVIVKGTNLEYYFNSIIYKFDEAQALEVEEELGKFLVFDDHDELIKEMFEPIVIGAFSLSIVYNINTKSYGPFQDLTDGDYIIINYDFESKTMQIIEIIDLEI